GVIRTTAADGSSDGPVVVYTAGRTTYTLREQFSLAVARTRCTLVGFGPTASVTSRSRDLTAAANGSNRINLGCPR
ncbi:MAG: hypothetical protein ACRDP7_24380, partial [Trebonia sp.]